MRKIINIILALCAIALCFACYFSIYNDISFDEEKAARENLVKARLMQIRDAEERERQAQAILAARELSAKYGEET